MGLIRRNKTILSNQGHSPLYVSSYDISTLPISRRRTTNKGRKPKKLAVITSSPYKRCLEESHNKKKGKDKDEVKKTTKGKGKNSKNETKQTKKCKVTEKKKQKKKMQKQTVANYDDTGASFDSYKSQDPLSSRRNI